MQYNGSAIEEFKDVWVFCEQRENKLVDTNFELIGEARRLADQKGVKVAALLLGSQIKHLAEELGGYGADKVIVCEDQELEMYTTETYTKAFCDIALKHKPEIILIGATYIGRDLAPRCAARLHTGLTADCTHLDIDMANYLEYLKQNSTINTSSGSFDMQDTNLKMTRPAFGGHLMATIICPRFRPCMSTVRPGVMKKAKYNQERARKTEVII